MGYADTIGMELYERVWAGPLRSVAKHYGFTDVRLVKVCKALWVPVPGRGYWAKKIAGRPTRKRPPLPPRQTVQTNREGTDHLSGGAQAPVTIGYPSHGLLRCTPRTLTIEFITLI
jgi:hypothetical protein